jgi:hypothetical protein
VCFEYNLTADIILSLVSWYRILRYHQLVIAKLKIMKKIIKEKEKKNVNINSLIC